MVFHGAVFLASSAGFEPTAFRLGGGRSILLSYEDVYMILEFFSASLYNMIKSVCCNNFSKRQRSAPLNDRHICFFHILTYLR